ncbi:MAG TPA: YbaN family protein [Bacteriovoracaceae bacterium]|nr:YbaN family protein [Bacteriovoracaceae bacterium]
MKVVWLVIAWISLALGFVGAFLPIIPTTPFLILSAFLFSKSSPRLHAWMLTLPIAGEGIRDWQSSRVIRPRAKVLAASMILLSVVLIWKSQNIPLIVQASVTALLISVMLFVITRKSGSSPQK